MPFAFKCIKYSNTRDFILRILQLKQILLHLNFDLRYEIWREALLDRKVRELNCSDSVAILFSEVIDKNEFYNG